MKLYARYYIATVLTFAAFFVQGQNFYESYKPHLIYNEVDSGKVAIHFYNNNFIKNNEYFGPYTEGITYIGTIIQPEITWICSKNFSFSAGWYLRQYFGHNGFENSLPVFRARYTFLPGANLIIGQLDGQRQHGYIEPIYSEDNCFIKNPEYGVQILLEKKNFSADFFMDWEKFLLPGEAHKEVITGGLLAAYAFNGLAENRGLSLHFQSIIHHLGGQVDVLDEPMETRSNLAAGLEYAFLPDLDYLKKITLASYYIRALELSPTNTIAYNKGFGFQNTIGFENNWMKLKTGWFHGEKFFAPLGDNLFQSITQFDTGYTQDIRELITSKLLLSHAIIKGVDLGFRFESYYDLDRKWNDFSYGLNISVNAKVFEHTTKAKLF